MHRLVIASFVTLAIVASAGSALAESGKVLVLRSEGGADKKLRARIDASVLKLAKSTSEAAAGDITYGEAAAAAGCKPDDAICKDDVLGMLGVDEIVTITAAPRPTGIEVSVQRIAKGGVTKTATAIVTIEQVEHLESIAPLFSREATPDPSAAIVDEPTPEPAPAVVPAPETIAEPTPSVVATPTPGGDHDDRLRGGRRLQAIGMIGGGAMVIAGLVFWGSASGLEGDIDAAPKRTKEDLLQLQDLEEEADSHALTGNVLVVTGALVAGVSTYFFLKGRRDKRSSSARVTPTRLGDGAGITLTFGGTP